MSIVTLSHELLTDHEARKPAHSVSSALSSIAIGKVKPVIKMLATDGIKLSSLLEGTGIQLSQLAIYDSKINDQQYFRLIENACQLAPDKAFALRLGEQQHINQDGVLSCLIMSCQNPYQAMHLLADYQSLLTQLFNLEFTEHQDYAVFTAKPAFEFDPCLAYFIEYTFSSIYALGKFCTGHSSLPLEYEFAYDGSEKHLKYELFFGSKVRFNCEYNRVIFPKSVLSLPFIFGDEQAAQLNDKICKDKIRLVHQNTSVIDQVRSLLVKKQFTEVSLQIIAEKLCMSPRTLRRHLHTEHISYKDLLEAERKREARRALTRNIPMKKVAEQLGYKDASSFSRAFKKWFGITPNEYKEQTHSFD